MKTVTANVIDFGSNVVEVIAPNYSPFVVTVTDRGVTINWGDKVIAQRHIHMHLDEGGDKDVQAALDSAYRAAMLHLAFEDRYLLQGLYRHLVRVTSDNLEQPAMVSKVTDLIGKIMQLTKYANDVNIRLVSETELDDDTAKEFTLTLRHDGEIFSADGNKFQMELANILTDLPILGGVESL